MKNPVNKKIPPDKVAAISQRDSQLNRPKIYWLRLALWLLIPIALTGLLIWLLLRLSWSAPAAVATALSLLALLVLLRLKQMAICAVTLYQRFAPASIRNKCRFAPSCSAYMLLSLEKYGFWNGFGKGLRRIRRCKAQDGGFDIP